MTRKTNSSRPLEVLRQVDTVRIGELAILTGEKQSTIIYYVRQGLLPYSQSAEKSFRIFDKAEALERLQAIKEMKRQNLSIEEIKQQLSTER